MEGQERNMAQLARIGAIVKWRWGLKENSWGSNKENKEEARDNEERSEEGLGESQEEVEEETPSSASY